MEVVVIVNSNLEAGKIIYEAVLIVYTRNNENLN